MPVRVGTGLVIKPARADVREEGRKAAFRLKPQEHKLQFHKTA